MSPAQARADDPGNANGCYAGYQATTAPASCLFGDPHGRVSVVLLGDSHAQQWFPALQRIALHRHWRLWVWTKSACPFIDLPVHLMRFEGRYPSCPAWRKSVLSRMATLSRVDAVIVSHFGELAREMDGRNGHLLGIDEVGPAWQQAWARTLGWLRPHARRVVVIRDVPTPSTDVPACLAEHGDDARRCSFGHGSAFHDADVLYNAERAAASPVTGFVDLTDLLCPGTTCPVVWTDGSIIYRDSHHLTATVSRALAPYLAVRLARLLGG